MFETGLGEGAKAFQEFNAMTDVGQHGRNHLSKQVLTNRDNVIGSGPGTSLKIWQIQEKCKFGNNLEKLRTLPSVKSCCNNNKHFSAAESSL